MYKIMKSNKFKTLGLTTYNEQDSFWCSVVIEKSYSILYKGFRAFNTEIPRYHKDTDAL